MSLDAFFGAHIDGAHLEVGLFYAEAVFYFPSPRVDSDDLAGVILKACRYGIEAVESCFGIDEFFVELGAGDYRQRIAIAVEVGVFHEASAVVGRLGSSCLVPVYLGNCALYLLGANLLLV